MAYLPLKIIPGRALLPRRWTDTSPQKNLRKRTQSSSSLTEPQKTALSKRQKTDDPHHWLLGGTRQEIRFNYSGVNYENTDFRTFGDAVALFNQCCKDFPSIPAYLLIDAFVNELDHANAFNLKDNTRALLKEYLVDYCRTHDIPMSTTSFNLSKDW